MFNSEPSHELVGSAKFCIDEEPPLNTFISVTRMCSNRNFTFVRPWQAFSGHGHSCCLFRCCPRKVRKQDLCKLDIVLRLFAAFHRWARATWIGLCRGMTSCIFDPIFFAGPCFYGIVVFFRIFLLRIAPLFARSCRCRPCVGPLAGHCAACAQSGLVRAREGPLKGQKHASAEKEEQQSRQIRESMVRTSRTCPEATTVS